MEPTLWLLVPGEWLARRWSGLAADAPLPGQGEVVVLLGVLFWIFWLAVAMLVWRFRHPGADALRRAGVPVAVAAARGAATRGAGQLVAAAQRSSWTLRDAWGALWRAEAVHLALYVLAPLAVRAASIVLLAVTLPFSAMGFADRNEPPKLYDPLAHAACWTFASWCPTPMAEFRALTRREEERCRAAACPAFVVDRDLGWPTFKVAWLVITVVWVTAWRRRRRDRQATLATKAGAP